MLVSARKAASSPAHPLLLNHMLLQLSCYWRLLVLVQGLEPLSLQVRSSVGRRLNHIVLQSPSALLLFAGHCSVHLCRLDVDPRCRTCAVVQGPTLLTYWGYKCHLLRNACTFQWMLFIEHFLEIFHPLCLAVSSLFFSS